MGKQYFEYRGVSDAVYAEVITDTLEAFVTGQVKSLTGVSEIGKAVNDSVEVHYYDNLPAIIIEGVGADDISINASGIPFEVEADITGQAYDGDTGMYIEQEPVQKDFAFGYVTKRTDGTPVYVWRLKGRFSRPSLTAQTEDSGTGANGQTLTFTGISTTHKFNYTSKPAKGINIPGNTCPISKEEFFAAVQTPDTIKGTTGLTYTLTCNEIQDEKVYEYPANAYVRLYIPYYAGREFLGWYMSADYSGDPVTHVVMSADITVYAKWRYL